MTLRPVSDEGNPDLWHSLKASGPHNADVASLSHNGYDRKVKTVMTVTLVHDVEKGVIIVMTSRS